MIEKLKKYVILCTMKKACKNFIRQKQMRSETVSALLVCIASKIDTKRKIMAATGFSWGSVATYVAELLDSGVIYECDDYAASAIDRRTSHYRLTSEEYYALGVEVTGAGIAFALMSADGTLLEKYSVPTWDIDNSNFFEIISSAYCDFIRISNYDNDKILVTVCSLTGAVDCNKKVWLFSPHHPEIKDYDLTVLEAIFPGKLKIEHDIISKARSIIYCYHIEDKSFVF